MRFQVILQWRGWWNPGSENHDIETRMIFCSEKSAAKFMNKNHKMLRKDYYCKELKNEKSSSP